AGIHTSTFQGTPVACAMARATLAEMKRGDLVAHAAGPVHDTFGQYLKDLETLPHVRDVRWIGAAAAIELQETDGSPSPSIRLKVQEKCFEQKLLVYGGGRQKNTIMLLPPINIDPDVLAGALSQLAKAVRDVH
ncbi:MAG: aminotransferase class III-fold pyridoxal phosphate-dependent enzyme, partial [Geminicoccaceae bacterium]